MDHLEYSQIDDYIYIGTTICCKEHLQELIRLGINTDIDLQDEKEDKPAGVQAFLWLPTIDFNAPSQAQLTIGADFLQDAVRHKMKCYVHCNAGEGRAPTLVAAYYILEGLTPTEALEKIKAKRPIIRPNRHQRAALKILYNHIKKIIKRHELQKNAQRFRLPFYRPV